MKDMPSSNLTIIGLKGTNGNCDLRIAVFHVTPQN